MAAGKKRVLDETSGNPKAKKTKTDKTVRKAKEETTKPTQPPSALVADEIDFPRGGGTTLTPLEVKTLRAEAAQEADKELFAVCQYQPEQFRVLTTFSGLRQGGQLQTEKEVRSEREAESRGEG